MIDGLSAFVVAVVVGGSGVWFGLHATDAEVNTDQEKRENAIFHMALSVGVLILALGVFAWALHHGSTVSCPAVEAVAVEQVEQ